MSGPSVTAPSASGVPPTEPVDFSDLPGWSHDDHAAAFAALRQGAQRLAAQPPKPRPLGPAAQALKSMAALITDNGERRGLDATRFFQDNFAPRKILAPGFLTGYYEPVVAASRTPSARFTVPLLKRPPDLIEISDGDRPGHWDPDMRFGRRIGSGLEVHPDRAAIESGALAGRNLELAFVENSVTAYFIHVQGSARLQLPDGTRMRIGFDGKSGHAYTSIGKLAVARRYLDPAHADKAGLEAWLRANPDQGRALMQANRSYIFFKEHDDTDRATGPVGAAGVALWPGRSLAVDRTLISFHCPIFVVADQVPDPQTGRPGPFARLMVAHDTGSAIQGPARGDIFYGTGDRAGQWAGRARHPATFFQLIPNAVAPAPGEGP